MPIWYDEEHTLEDVRDKLPNDLFQDELGRTLPPREAPIHENDFVNPDDWSDNDIDDYYEQVKEDQRARADQSRNRSPNPRDWSN